MKSTFRPVLLLPMLLAACSQPTATAPVVTPPPIVATSPTLLGYVEVTAGKIGPSEQSVRWVTPTAEGFKPLALAQLPNSLQLYGDQNVTWSFDNGKTRYLATTLDVRNVASTPQDTKNVYFMAVDTPQTIGDTAISAVLNDDGQWISDLDVARHIFPTHDVIPPGKVLTIGADFVAFAESEIQGLVPSGGGVVLPWGFAVRHCLENGLDYTCSLFNRTLPASDAQNSYDAIVTFSFQAPVLTSDKTPDAVKAVYAVYKDVGARPRITQSIQEQAAGTVAGLNTVPSGFDVTKFPGSKLTTGNLLTNLRISGTASNPTSTLLPIVVPPPADPCSGASGTLVKCFGTNGVVSLPPIAQDSDSDVNIRPFQFDSQGRILLAGRDSNNDGVIFRYTSTGILDPSFNGSGKVSLHLNTINAFTEMAPLPDGKIIAIFRSTQDWSAAYQYLLVRYTSSGQLDTSFGNGGKLLPQFSQGSAPPITANFITQLNVASDGSIYVLVDYSLGSSIIYPLSGMYHYLPNGTLDKSFGNGGKLASTFSWHNLLLDKNNNIVVVGIKDSGVAFSRYTSKGVLDTTFGSGGISKNGPLYYLQNLSNFKQLSNGKFITGGLFGLTGYTAQGVLDTTFGINGLVATKDLVPTGINLPGVELISFSVTPSGKILLPFIATTGGLQGHPPHYVPGDTIAILARLTSSGQIDPAFAKNGRYYTFINDQSTSIGDTYETPSGKIIFKNGSRELRELNP